MLTCDCSSSQCFGSFRLSFDGQYTTKLASTANTTDLIAALESLETLVSADLTILIEDEEHAICIDETITNTTITFKGSFGNVPRLGLLSNVIKYANQGYFSSNNASVLTLSTNDGRDDNVKICNGIGTCDYRRGLCVCPFVRYFPLLDTSTVCISI